ncbi:MAG TPA: hypothetical protein VGO40_22565 [Longimicrobium sp.]|jgi:hypothetical protein|nr:hypothetical protein [Longimicrobium sp.]
MTDTSDTRNAPTPAPAPTRGLSGIPLFLAALALVLWVVFAVMMLVNAKAASEVFWARLAFLFASVEAIAFGAAGALWGVTIQKERAERAERAAEENAQDAANGRALAAATLADAADVVEEDRGTRLERLGVAGADPGEKVLQRHAQLARRLFPDV